MTRSEEIVEKVSFLYAELEKLQKDWYEKTKFTCPSGCGSCCIDFEPDLYEAEVIYMADWLIKNRPETAESLAQDSFPSEPERKTCIFFDPESDYHCTIYGGRPFICRLFGCSSFHGKNGKTVWKPCKFYPAEKLSQHKPPLAHRQYTFEETVEILGAVPPVMADIMEQGLSLCPGQNETEPLRECLPKIIRKLLMEKAFNIHETRNSE